MKFGGGLLLGFDTNAPGITPNDFVMVGCAMLTPGPTGIDCTISSSNQTKAINNSLVTTGHRYRCGSTADHNYLTNIDEVCIFNAGVEFHQRRNSSAIFFCDPGECISFLYSVSDICHRSHPPFNHCATNQSLDCVRNSASVVISNTVDNIRRLLDLAKIFAQVIKARRDKTFDLGIV